MNTKNMPLFALRYGLVPGLLALAISCGKEKVNFVEHSDDHSALSGDAASKAGKKSGSGDANAANSSEASFALGDRIERNFVSSRQDHANLGLELTSSGDLLQRVTMSGHSSNLTANYTQITRPEATDIFAQGSNGQSATENFQQSTMGVLDLLVVIDSSGSMTEEQVNLANKLNPLMSYVAQSDWQIGIVTTDPAAGCMRRIIRKADLDRDAAFAQGINAGIAGSGNERGILQAVNGLKGECLSSPWLRSNSTVAVLIVSDEDNCSANGGDCAGQPYATPDYLTNYLASIRSVGTNARVYGLIKHPSAAAACTTAANTGTQYAQAITATNGTWGSICDGDYSGTLQSISQNISVILQSQFALQHTPVAGSVSVTMNGTPMSSGYSVTGNVLNFTSAPSASAQIAASYLYGQTPLVNQFTLAQSAVASGMRAYVNDVQVDSSTFSYNSGNNKVTFTSTPPSDSNIRVIYRRNIALPTSFAIGTGVKNGSVTASLNGAASSAFTVDYAGGNVNFNPAPPDAAAIAISYSKIGDPILSYPLLLSGNEGQLEANDAATSAAVPFSLASGSVVFPANEFRDGRVILLKYPSASTTPWTEHLAVTPVAGSIKVTGPTGVACTSFVLSGSELNLAPCGFTAGAGVVAIEFDYILERITSFAMDDPLFQSDKRQQWTVWVNDVESKGYEKAGTVISFPGGLSDGARIRVEVLFAKAN